MILVIAEALFYIEVFGLVDRSRDIEICKKRLPCSAPKRRNGLNLKRWLAETGIAHAV